MSDRAAVFTSQPQDVEIYERGAWWPGMLLGWRHDVAGACQVWVRVEFAGVVEDAWVDLSLLRLPEARPERRHGSVDPGAVLTGRRAARVPSARQLDDEPRTQHLPLVRDAEAPRAGRPAGSTGGRRRAPEPPAQGESPAVVHAHYSVPSAGRVPGRHRAPADPGRHRATDTGVLSAVSPEATLAPTSWTPPPPRTELPPPGPAVRSNGVRADDEADGLTRPMRLEDGVGSARRSRRDALSSA